MHIDLGVVYRFTFEDPFSGLGYSIEAPTKGYYKVVEILTFEQILQRGIDLVPNLYEYVGLGETEYQAARSGFVGIEFWQLQDVYTNDNIYMPTTAIVEIPIVDVAAYSKVMLVSKIGVMGDRTDLDEISAIISGILQYKYGITLTPNDIQLAIYDTQWMLTSEYQAIVEARDAIKGTGSPAELDGEALPVNLWSIIKRLKLENASQAGRIAALEEHIRTLAGG